MDNQFMQEPQNPTNPLNPDSDNDGIQDGIEVNGWEVNIIYFVGDKMNNKQWHVYSNPLLSNSDLKGENDYFSFSNGLDPYSIDTDGDGNNQFPSQISSSLSLTVFNSLPQIKHSFNSFS